MHQGEQHGRTYYNMAFLPPWVAALSKIKLNALLQRGMYYSHLTEYSKLLYFHHVSAFSKIVGTVK